MTSLEDLQKTLAFKSEKNARMMCAAIALNSGGYVPWRKLARMTKEEWNKLSDELRNARKQGIRRSWLTDE